MRRGRIREPLYDPFDETDLVLQFGGLYRFHCCFQLDRWTECKSNRERLAMEYGMYKSNSCHALAGRYGMYKSFTLLQNDMERLVLWLTSLSFFVT